MLRKIGITISILFLTFILAAEINPFKFPKIEVIGKAKIVKQADKAVISFSVEGEGTSLGNALEDAKFKIDQLSLDLKDLGFRENDISTSKFESKSGSKIIFGLKNYEVKISAKLEVRDLSKLEKAIIKISNHKIKMINSVNFKLINIDEVFQQTQIDAVKAAKIKADKIAAELQVKIGGVYNVEQLESRIEGETYRYRNYRKKINISSYDSNPDTNYGNIFSDKINISAKYKIVFKIVNK